MSPAFGFSVGDFIAAIELCTKVAKALKEASTAAAEYQQVVLELQGLQNVLSRLAALEPTESNIQYVNAIRGAALASTLPLQEFLSKLEKFDKSMSPFAAKTKTLSLSKAGRQTEYALFMADEVKKIRAVVYGNVIRINVMLATHSSETASRIESQAATGHRELIERFNETRDDMAKVANEFAGLKAEMNASRDEAAQKAATSAAQMQDQLRKAHADTTSLTQSFSNLSVGISSIRSLSSQILSLLRVIPAELGSLIQNVIRSNARTESALLRIEQNIAASPSLKNDSNIRIEDALGRPHDLPYEWFRYWETIEGLMKAKFKDLPGNHKIDSGEFRLVHRKRPSIAIDKESWSAAIGPGADLVMLMLITDVVFGESSCPRRSCSGKVSSKDKLPGFSTCPECGLQFMSEVAPAEDFGAEEIAELQRLEDDKLFGMREESKLGLTNVMDPMQIPDITWAAWDSMAIETEAVSENTEPDVFLKFVSASKNDSERKRVESRMETNDHADRPSVPPYQPPPPIFSWLAQTVPPENPDSVREWREAEETQQQILKEREVKDLEVFRNVKIIVPSETEKLHSSSPTARSPDENKLEVGARVFYRNILDQYPLIDRSFARRLAKGNWERQKIISSKHEEVERVKIRNQPPRLKDLPQEIQDALNRSPAAQKARKGEGASVIEIEREHEDGDGKIQSSVPPHYQPILKTPSTSNLALRQDNDSKIPRETAYISQTSRPIMQMKERKICNLPPLPVALHGKRTTDNSRICYLCHSEVYLETKQRWRSHVMQDLQPYMCPVLECSLGDAMYANRRGLMWHLVFAHNTDENAKCPFCGNLELSGAMKLSDRTFIKHVGHHMEDVAFAVVSTAYENWSYDESASEPELLSPTDLFESHLKPLDGIEDAPWDTLTGLPDPILGSTPLPGCVTEDSNAVIIPTTLIINHIPSPVENAELMSLMRDLKLPLPYSLRSHSDNDTGRAVIADFMVPEWAAQVLEALNRFEFRGVALEVQYKNQSPPAEREIIEREKRQGEDSYGQHRPVPGDNLMEGDIQYQDNFWTGDRVATSPASSANSPLRDPWPADYLTAGRAGSVHGYLASRPSSPTEEPWPMFSSAGRAGTATTQIQEAKRRRRRESHNVVERRRRDMINDCIKDLADLVPSHRLQDEKIRKRLARGEVLDETDQRTNDDKDSVEKLDKPTKGLPLEYKDKGPNKGEILTGAVGWTKDLMWFLQKKIQDTDKMEARLRELTGKQWRRETINERRITTEFFDTIELSQAETALTQTLYGGVRNDAAKMEAFRYTRGPGSGLWVPKHTTMAGEPLNRV